jgi:hypothetical protein
VLKLKFEIKPLPYYCIDRPKLGDLFVYKVLLRVHPWGVNFIFIKLKIYHCNFKNFCFCVRKVDCVLKAYVHIGGWWMLVLLDELVMHKLYKVNVFSYLWDFSRFFTISCINFSIVCAFIGVIKIPLCLRIMKQHKNDFFCNIMRSCV